MINKYGVYFADRDVIEYFKMMIGKIFKVLPMHEDGCPTLQKYLDMLQIELSGAKSLMFRNDELFLELTFCIEGLTMLNNMDYLKPTVFKCIGLCEKIIHKLEVNSNG